MSFADYQQNYHELHERALESRRFGKPVVNSEYGYHLRDRDGDGVPDKSNSTSIEAIRHATWDIVMAGAYVVTGFGSTYFGGHRDPGPFDVDAPQNDDWEEQIALIREFFEWLEYWRLEPHDQLVRGATPRGEDTEHLGRRSPPAVTYWCLADPGRTYVVYVRGLDTPVHLQLGAGDGLWTARRLDPRSGEVTDLGPVVPGDGYEIAPPDLRDWVVWLQKQDGGG